MAGKATDWDLWAGGLFSDGMPEPPGRRGARELAALHAEHDRNFALACFRANEDYRRKHGPPATPQRNRADYAAERHVMDRLGLGAD